MYLTPNRRNSLEELRSARPAPGDKVSVTGSEHVYILVDIGPRRAHVKRKDGDGLVYSVSVKDIAKYVEIKTVEQLNDPKGVRMSDAEFRNMLNQENKD